jgi:stalled ribosome alternative rescue factor ArfA
MHKLKLLHNVFKKTLSFIHKKRLGALFDAVNALMSGASLTLTSLGRNMHGKAKERHQIRKMDRLLGNANLQNERKPIYKALNKMLISVSKPVISVDWSCLSYKDERYLLRASISIKGRSMVCYQEVHPKSAENNASAHNRFLDNLKQVLPEHVLPIIITDAIFSVLWFKKVQSFGWDFIGRVRTNRGSYYDIKEKSWCGVNAAYKEATSNPKILSDVLLTKASKLLCRLIVYKKLVKGRVKKNRKGKIAKGSYNEVQAKSNRDPWVLATSLQRQKDLAKLVVLCYSSRMQIEEEFRDTKNRRFGFGLSESGTKIHARVEVLLIINVLATFLCWVLACTTIKKKQHVDYHANSEKAPIILSAIFLGLRVFRKITNYPRTELKDGINEFLNLVSEAQCHASP